MKYLLQLLLIVLLCSCVAPRSAYKKNYNFADIKTISVGKFSSFKGSGNSGSVVENEFVKQLIELGYSVKINELSNTDVILSGSVSEYFPNRRFLIRESQSNGQQNVVVAEPAVEISGSHVYNLGSAFGLEGNNQIVVSNATVGIYAYIKDIKTGEVVWSNSYAYEGLDLNTALESTVKYLLNSLPK